MAEAAKKKRRRVVAPRLDDYVEEHLAGMHSYSQVTDLAMKEFECSERTVTMAIARVRAKWHELDGATVMERRSRFRAELEYAWKRALQAGDYRAIAVMSKTRADVEGIRAMKKVEHGGIVGLRPVAAMSPQEREREIEILLAKRRGVLEAGGKPVIDVPTLDPSPAELEPVELPPDIRPSSGKRKTKSKSKTKPRIH